ncbi:hypothetical protein SADUNF_Sadunf10G0050000 [Salix dunnii]|uniref:Uncharacterized protein n=1 Tax=Salix dunnii TaxID=1413687 RepID=A0A835MU93_9ROSI|nr:hypothetical protein SADUNF_Sadunf10G0050000 [Salix dunnii]
MRKTNLCFQGLRQPRRLIEEGKSLELHFPAEDLDFSLGTLKEHLFQTVMVLQNHLVVVGGTRTLLQIQGSRLLMNMRVLSNSLSEAWASFCIIASCTGTGRAILYCHLNFLNSVTEEFEVSAKVCIMWTPDTFKGAGARSKKASARWEDYIDVAESRKSSNSFHGGACV